MGSICGIFYKNNEKVNPKQISAMLDKLNYWDADKKNMFVESNIGLGVLQLENTIFSENENQPFINNNLIVVCDARIDNRKELAETLDCNYNLPDSEIISLAYQKWGNQCAKHLVGDYAFAVWDKQNNNLFCARDHAGFRPFFYYQDKEKFVFASEIKAVLSLEGIKTNIDQAWIADCISTIVPQKHLTIYKEINRLESAHSLEVNQNSTIKNKYWDLDFSKKLYLNSEDEYIAAFRETLIESINCRLQTNYPVASELSGGIDSSGVSAIAFHCLNKDNSRFFALSHVLPDELLGKVHPFADERDFSNLVCEFSGIENHIYVTSSEKTIIKEMQNAAKAQDGIMPQNLYLFSDELYEKAAEKKCRTLLSGFGGDEFVSNSCSGYIENLVHNLKFRKALKKIRVTKKLPFYRLFRLQAYLLYEYMPFVYKLFRNRNKWVKERYKELLFSKEFGKELQIRKRYSGMKGFPMDKSMEMRQYKRFSLPHVSMRHETCCIAAKQQKLEYTYPLWDRRLLELFFSFPSEIKYGNGRGRYIYRKSLEGFVPPKVQYRADKTGTTISTVDLRILNDKEKIRSLIEKMELEGKKVYVDYDRMKVIFEKIIEKATNPKAEKVNKGVFLKALKILVFQSLNESEGNSSKTEAR